LIVVERPRETGGRSRLLRRECADMECGSNATAFLPGGAGALRDGLRTREFSQSGEIQSGSVAAALHIGASWAIANRYNDPESSIGLSS